MTGGSLPPGSLLENDITCNNRGVFLKMILRAIIMRTLLGLGQVIISSRKITYNNYYVRNTFSCV